MSIGGTAAYRGVAGLPPLVERAVAAARRLHFDLSCRPEQGRLLRVLASGRAGGTIGETGTGCGVGLAWMAAGVDRATRLVSIERDRERAEVARGLFSDHDNVTVLCGESKELRQHGPFDLLVLDGGGAGKQGDPPIEARDWLTLLGTVVIDDFTPCRAWPPVWDGQPDDARLFWLQHPHLLSTEIRLAVDLASIVGVRRL